MKASSNDDTRVLRDGDFIVIRYKESMKAGVYHENGDSEYLAYLSGGKLCVEEIDGHGVERIIICENGETDKLELKDEIEQRYNELTKKKGNMLKSLLSKKGG